jgi:RNA polymerase sigma-70 factor (ECF subfamily)
MAVLRKDRKATAEFVNRYSNAVYAYLHSRLFPRVDVVDDLLQEVFLAAWENLPGFQGRSSLKNWLVGIARHKVEGYYRAQLRAPKSLPDEEDEPVQTATPTPSFDELMDRERLHKKTREVLATLPESYRVVLLWRYWERRSVLEMAEQTGKTVKAIERLLARARQQFKRRWNGE